MYGAMYHRAVARMIRKQVYIEERHDRLLKRYARQRGATEAELIREGIELLGRRATAAPSRERALREFWAFARKRAAMRVPQTGRTWTREELYEERLARHSR